MESGTHSFSTSDSSLHDLCLCKLIEEFDHYSPEMLSLLPPIQRKELLLYCPVVSICHLEHTCAFNGINSDIFWDELLKNQIDRHGNYDINAHEELLHASQSQDYEISFLSNHEKYFTFLTAMIFCGDRFSGHYAMFTNKHRVIGVWEDCFDGSTPPPEERSCPGDIVNRLVAYRKPGVVIEEVMDTKEQLLERDSSESEFYYPLPIRDAFGWNYGELFKEATKGQHVHSKYSCYILKENHYRLSSENAIALMMNECDYYPKKLFMHEYDDNLKWLLTQFFDRLESITLDFREGTEIRNYVYSRDAKYVSNVGDSKKSFEVVLNCCFSSPVLRSLVITDPIGDDRVEFFSTLSRKLGPSLKTITFRCQGYKTCYFGSVHKYHSFS